MPSTEHVNVQMAKPPPTIQTQSLGLGPELSMMGMTSWVTTIGIQMVNAATHMVVAINACRLARDSRFLQFTTSRTPGTTGPKATTPAQETIAIALSPESIAEDAIPRSYPTPTTPD